MKIHINPVLVVLARNFGSNARLLPFPTPESYSCTSRIRERQVTPQLTKKTAKKRRRTCRYCEYLNLGRKRSSRPKETVKNVRWSMKLPKKLQKCNKSKTNPNEPNFQRPIPVFKRISRIFEDFKTNFFCKTNPMVWL